MTDKVPTPVDLLASPIFFDGVTNQGFVDGIANIVLVAKRWRPDGDGLKYELVVTGDLRCTVAGLLALKSACENALLLAIPKPADEKAN